MRRNPWPEPAGALRAGCHRLRLVFCLLPSAFPLYGRFHQNTLAQSRGAAVLPALPIVPQFAPKKKRRLRTAALVSLLLFAVCFVLGYAACALSAGSFQFWHVWGWFRN